MNEHMGTINNKTQRFGTGVSTTSSKIGSQENHCKNTHKRVSWHLPEIRKIAVYRKHAH